MQQNALQLLAPTREEHADAVIDMVARNVRGYEYYDMCRRARSSYLHSPYCCEASRIGVMDGEIVTHFGVWDFQMRIGGARVRCGGVGAVATHAHFRRRGLMADTARASIAAMRELGFDLSLLFGIADFYHRFGYCRAWSEKQLHVDLADLPAEPPAGQVEPFDVRQDDRRDRLYNRQYAAATGTAVRPTYATHEMVPGLEGFGWTDKRGSTSGYVIVTRSNDAIDCVEHIGDVDQGLRVLAMLARRQPCRTVRLSYMPEDSPIRRRVRWGNCRESIAHRRCGGAMVCTINLAQTLGKLADELGARLRVSACADWRGELLVADSRDKVLLAIDRSTVTVRPAKATKHAIRGGHEIAQLLIGVAGPDDVIEAAGMRLTGDARALARALFPAQHPMLCRWDRF